MSQHGWPFGHFQKFFAGSFILLLGMSFAAQGNPEKRFVGSKSCQPCHPQEFERFSIHSKKSRSYASLTGLQKFLSPSEFEGCLTCHTTGYRQPGGFQSVSLTPELKDAGCEVCHGPGSIHVETGASTEIQRKIPPETCASCHQGKHLNGESFRPLMFGGAH